MVVCLYVYFTSFVCLFVCMYVYFFKFICLFVCSSVCLFVCPSPYLFFVSHASFVYRRRSCWTSSIGSSTQFSSSLPPPLHASSPSSPPSTSQFCFFFYHNLTRQTSHSGVKPKCFELILNHCNVLKIKSLSILVVCLSAS